MTARQLNGALRERGLTQNDFARLTGIAQPTVSQILAGNLPLDPTRKARMEAAITELGLTEPVAPDPREPVFELPVRADEGE